MIKRKCRLCMRACLCSSQLSRLQGARLGRLRAGAPVCPAPHLHLTVRTPRPKEGLQPTQGYTVHHSKAPDSTRPQVHIVSMVMPVKWLQRTVPPSPPLNTHFNRILPSD